MRTACVCIFLTSLPLAAGPCFADTPATTTDWAKGAQLYSGMGDFHRKITTASPAGQSYFDQGMRFLWAFNHDEATRSFAKAAQLDSNCAMCWWGIALTLGPNYNMPMMAETRAKAGWNALQRAKARAPHASPVEQALVGALSARFRGPQPLNLETERPLLVAYSKAMQGVAAKFPADLDVQTMTAEAMMTVNAWKLWTLDGTAAPGTTEIVSRLEGVLAKDPRHPGANHYLIHAVEASRNPERAESAAERLRGMMPAAGHLEHMPAHIFQRVGRYEDAAEANRKGAAADLAYFRQTSPPDYYAMYTAHNYQFLAYSAAMEGRKAEAVDAARRARATIPDMMLMEMPGVDWQMGELYAAMVRFGMWDDILAEPEPNAKLRGLVVAYRHARAAALAAKAQVDQAKVELTTMVQLAVTTPPDDGAGLNTARDVFAVAVLDAKARIAWADGQPDAAIALMRETVAKEDQLAYDEPADWFVPTRHALGAALLKTGRPTEAEAVYREDLNRHKSNGWALFGLAQSLQAQGREADAAAARQGFDAAWRSADTTLTASVF